MEAPYPAARPSEQARSAPQLLIRAGRLIASSTTCGAHFQRNHDDSGHGQHTDSHTAELNALFCCKVFRQPLRWRRCRSYVPVGAGRLHGSPGLVSPCRSA